MKVYVFGGDKDACIGFANQLNSSGASAIIAKEDDTLRDVAGRIGKAFDRAVMISDDPMRDSIAANRDARVRAAPCYSQKALKAAANSDVNLFVLERDAYDRLDLSDILGASASRQQPTQKEKREEPPKRDQKKQQPPPPEPRQQEQSESRHGGVGGRLKDIFGIVEE